VALQRNQDDARLARVRTHVEARLEADAQAHRREVRVGQAAGEVPRWIDVCAARALNREPERVVDHAAARLVVAREAGKDRQAGRVRGCPACRSDLVRAQAPGRTGPGVPAAALRRETAELVEAAGGAVDQQ